MNLTVYQIGCKVIQHLWISFQYQPDKKVSYQHRVKNLHCCVIVTAATVLPVCKILENQIPGLAF